MATTSTTTGAQGSGPIAYTDGDGNQLVIPLSDIKFKDGKLQTDGVSADLATWLKYLFDQGQLSAGAQPPAKPAFLIQATDPTAAGNDITIVITNVTSPTPPTTPATFDATIKETHTYTGLSWNAQDPNFVLTILGTTSKLPAHPGLVHVQDASNPPKAPNATPETPLDISGTVTRASLKIMGASGDAFVLEARKDGEEGKDIMVTIDQVDASSETFRLVATYAPKTVTGIDPTTDLPNKLQGTNKWEITVSAPRGGIFVLPAEDTYTLTGGIDSASGLGGTKGASAAVTVKAQAS